jgi:hypothetical protein
VGKLAAKLNPEPARRFTTLTWAVRRREARPPPDQPQAV